MPNDVVLPISPFFSLHPPRPPLSPPTKLQIPETTEPPTAIHSSSAPHSPPTAIHSSRDHHRVEPASSSPSSPSPTPHSLKHLQVYLLEILQRLKAIDIGIEERQMLSHRHEALSVLSNG
ncbi:hypothetical protein AHAS_Ahas07G0028400 [Arachis hypogaea]